jgi:hypothetical protein
MSTPTDKSMRPMDSFVRVPHETQGPGGRERHPIDSDSEPIRPPYAPAKAREGADAEGDPGENDPLRSPYAPKKLRTQSAQAPRVAEDVTPLAPPRGPESLRETSDRHALGSELDISLQPMHRHGQQTEGPTPGRRAESLRDLKRLETTLRRIQREEAAARIPRAAQLPPVPGLVTPDASGRLRSREMLDFPSPRSLKLERIAASADEVAPSHAPRSARHLGRQRLRDTARILLFDRRLEPVLTAFAWTANRLARSAT